MLLPNKQLLQTLSTLPKKSKIMVIGEVDTGKSTMVKFISQWFLENKGYSIAVVDADVGQSNIGPPGFISFEILGQNYSTYNKKASYLVGKTSPYGKELSIVMGTTSCVRFCEQKADIILVDTCGLVDPPKGVQLKCAKAEAIRPDFIIVLHTAKISPLVGSLKLLGFNTINFIPLDKAEIKPYEIRKENRISSWNSYLKSADYIDINKYGIKIRPWWEESRFIRKEEIPSGTVAAVPNPRIPYFQIPCLWVTKEGRPFILGPSLKDLPLETIWISSYKLKLENEKIVWA